MSTEAGRDVETGGAAVNNESSAQATLAPAPAPAPAPAAAAATTISSSASQVATVLRSLTSTDYFKGWLYQRQVRRETFDVLTQLQSLERRAPGAFADAFAMENGGCDLASDIQYVVVDKLVRALGIMHMPGGSRAAVDRALFWLLGKLAAHPLLAPSFDMARPRLEAFANKRRRAAESCGAYRNFVSRIDAVVAASRCLLYTSPSPRDRG